MARSAADRARGITCDNRERVFDAVAQALDDRSPLRAHLGGFTPRAEQLALAEAVAVALKSGSHLIAEAGTGVGKGLAYLVPAAFLDRRVVVSTATKTLQEQLRRNDVPLARIATGIDLTCAVVKGRANYVCRAQLAVAGGRLPGIDLETGLERLRPWLLTTRTGDRDELDHLPPRDLWHELAVGADRCRGRRCSFVQDCYAEQARARAETVDVVLVNHALYMADLGVRMRTGGALSILPEHDVVVFDEAHAVEDAAADWLGVRLSLQGLQRFVRDVEQACDGARLSPPSRYLRALMLHAERLFAALPGGARARLTDARLAALPTGSADGMHQALDVIVSTLEGASDEADALARHAAQLSLALQEIVAGGREDTVVWCERPRPADVELRTAPIDVAPILRERLWSELESAVLVSATLAVGDEMRHVRRRLGLDDAVTLELPSPFDVRRHARLYVPSELPAPHGPAGMPTAVLADEIERLLDASRGRALVLFASHRALIAVHAELADRLPFPLLRQGELPRPLLLERFRSEVDSVLFATASFWQGVDIPGEALSLVVIEKLPFAPPDDPLVEARCEAAQRDGASGFAVVQLPRAAMLLKQGFGRLLRTEEDRGVVAILDRRLVTASYGSALRAALPEAPLIDSVDEVASFLAEGQPVAG